MKITAVTLLAFSTAIASAQTLTLQNAVSSARANRAAVQAARLKVEQARLSRRALTALSPTILSLGYTSDARVGGTDDDLVISQPLDLFGRRSASRRIGDTQVLQAEASLRQTELDIQNDVVSRYVDAAAAEARVGAARQAEESAGQLLAAVRGLVEGGKLPGVQATRVSIELQRATASRKQRESEASAARTRLAAAISQPTFTFGPAFPEIPVADIPTADLIRSRGDLLLLQAEVDAARADAGLARSNRLPQLEFQARRSAWQDEPVYGARIQFSFPIFNNGTSRNEESAARKRAEAAERSLEDALKLAMADSDAARQEVVGAQSQVAALDEVLASTQDLVARTQAGLREGANTLLDVLDANRALREIQESRIEALATLAAAQARFLRSTGTLLEVR